MLDANLIQVYVEVTYQKMIMYVIERFFGMRISNMISKLNFWTLDPAGSQPDPGIEVTYQKMIMYVNL